MTLPPTPTTPTAPPANAGAGAEARRQIAAWIEDSCSQNNNIFQGLSSNLRIEDDWAKALHFYAYEERSAAAPRPHGAEFLKRRQLILGSSAKNVQPLRSLTRLPLSFATR